METAKAITGETGMHESNWIKTGGQYGKTRALPTFEIVHLPNGRFGLKDETTGKMVAFGYASPDQLIGQFSRQAERRVAA
jgi:hypothetical protein